MAAYGSINVPGLDKFDFIDAQTLEALQSTNFLPVIEGDSLYKAPADLFGGQKTVTCVVGTSTAGHTLADCDYLCDGTDDQVEINQAISSLVANGGTVKFLSGTYVISSYISLYNTISLIGSPGTKIQSLYDYRAIVENDTPQPLKYISSEISGLTIENAGGHDTAIGIKVDSYTDGRIISNCIFSGFHIGIQFGYAANNCIVYGSSQTPSPETNSVGIQADFVTNCIIYNCCYGIYNAKITIGNMIHGCSIKGIDNSTVTIGNYVFGGSINYKPVSVGITAGNITCGNTISYCQIGIEIKWDKHICIGNLVYPLGTVSGTTTIQATSDSKNSLIMGNILIPSTYINSGTNNTFVDNKVVNS